MKTIVVTDQSIQKNYFPKEIEIIPVLRYLMNEGISDTTSLRVINLCQSYEYQSLGYYTSLLAEARGHKVSPSVLTIKDFERNAFESIINVELARDIQETIRAISPT